MIRYIFIIFLIFSSHNSFGEDSQNNKEKNPVQEKTATGLSKNEKKVVFSCGSGVTATVLALAYYLINTKYKPSIYDGSWAEYGKF